MLSTNDLLLESGGAVQTSTYGTGDGGNILVTPLNSDLPSELLISGIAEFNTPKSSSDIPFAPTGGYSSSLITSTESLDIFLVDDPYYDYDLDPIPQSNGRGGNIRVQDFNIVTINNGGTLSARSRSEGAAGNITVSDATDINITDGGQIVTAAYREGEAGTISIEATDSINISGVNFGYNNRISDFATIYAEYLRTLFTESFDIPVNDTEAKVRRRVPIARDFTIDPVSAVSGLQAQAGNLSSGSGLINIRSDGKLLLSNSASIDSNNFGIGDSLGILIEANEVDIQNQSSISSAVLNNPRRDSPINGGFINIEANLLSIQNSELAVSTFGLGNSGNILLNIEDSLKAEDSSSIRSTVEDTGIGRGGDVEINTASIQMLNGSQITAGVFRAGRIFTDLEGNPMTAPGGRGDGGNITVNATDSIVLSGIDPDGFGSGFLTPTEEGAEGNAGSIFVSTPKLKISDGAVIVARTDNESDAGGVNLLIGESLIVSNGGLISVDGSLSNSNIPGEPGNIAILPLNLDVPIEELFSFETGDQVPYLDGAPSIKLSEGGKIQARTNSTDSANITIIGNSLSLEGTRILPLDTDNTCPTCNDISASAEGNNATGGNIFLRLNAIRAKLDESSDIAANAVGEGGGGRIQLLLPTDAAGRTPFDLNAMFRLEEGRSIESDLDASSELGIQGSVEVGETAVVESVDVPLPLDPTTLVNRSCELQASDSASEFRVVGRGGLPTTPGETLNEETLLEDLGPPIEDGIAYQETDATQIVISHDSGSIENISEPQGWKRTSDGRLVLYSATSSTHSPVELDTSCASASEQHGQIGLL